MSSDRPLASRWRRRLLVTAVAALAAVSGSLFGLAAPASAHGQFVSSDPAKDATIGNPLASLVLYFTERPTSNAFFSVTAPSGARVDRLWSHGTSRALDTPVHEYFHQPDGQWEARTYNRIYAALLPIAYWPEAGAYKVTYVSVATDGEPVRGDFTFNYAGALTPLPADFRAQKNEPDPNLLAVSGTDQPTAPPTAGPAEPVAADEDSGPGVWVILVPVVLALIVAVVMLAFWRWRPARKLLVARFGGRYAAEPPPLQLPAQLQKIQERLPSIRRR